MKLKTLEMKLERLGGFSRPALALEQYATPASLAARLLFHASMRGDIEGRHVCDLGCGAGVLACGAALLGAEDVTGVDIDPAAIAIAEANARSIGAKITFIAGDVSEKTVAGALGECDTVVMNPPFGAQVRGADRPFIDRALECAQVVYGIFNAGSLPFLTAYIRGRGTIDEVIAGRFTLRHTFAHHRKERVEIEVEIVRLLKCE